MAGPVVVVTEEVLRLAGRKEAKMRKKSFVYIAVLASLFLFFAPQKVRAEAPERPVNSTVLDEFSYLSEQTISEIDEKNRIWENTAEQLQVGVCIVEYLPEDSDLESIANETFRKWQVGFSGTNNGVLLYIAIEDRKFRIETSDNASIRITDAEAKRILESARPFFRAEEYSAGVLYLVNAIGDAFYGTDQAAAILKNADLPKEKIGFSQFLLMIVRLFTSESGERLIFYFFLICFIMWNRGGDSGDHWSGGSRGSSGGGWSSGGGSSGGSSGGGWSGGGGGGGGASSGW